MLNRSDCVEREHNSGFQSGNSLPSYGVSQGRHSSSSSSNDAALYARTSQRSLGMGGWEYGFGLGDIVSSIGAPNRHNPNAPNTYLPVQQHQPYSSFQQLQRPSSNASLSSRTLYTSSPPMNRDSHHFRVAQQPQTHLTNSAPLIPSSNNPARSTLWWGEIEPWMDEEYAKQVCGLMGWEPVQIKVPHPAPDPISGQQANNPGYCFLTFPTAAHAASVIAQISNNPKDVTMPNSSKPFVLNWASSATPGSPLSPSALQTSNGTYSSPATVQQYPKEYSIFVGDLAPETSNSDLVAVFRNPVLGLRNDREPKFIRPFTSCKSAKIMLDPVTGVSRGYGFVRFTDEADQQRALIEMHGLYCLSRPMRISPATAKFKPPPSISALDLPQVQFNNQPSVNSVDPSQAVTLALPLTSSTQSKSVSAPIAASPLLSLGGNASSSPTSGTSIPASGSSNPLSTSSSNASLTPSYNSMSSEDMLSLPNNILAQIAQQYANNEAPVKLANGTVVSPFAPDSNLRQKLAQMNGNGDGPPRYTINEESWKHHVQARAILGNLIGPNGEQLTSMDPYNTTVFVGGLSPLISEETLRTFFAPFGDIHYVKVPVGKHCGFVQFVRKADAERAIEKMQGFPVGGSRIRLSWGRSQYKAAQAAAQAAQTAALQAHPVTPPISVVNPMTHDQAVKFLQEISGQGYSGATVPEEFGYGDDAYSGGLSGSSLTDHHSRDIHESQETLYSNGFTMRPDVLQQRTLPNSFSPFSPEPNAYYSDPKSTPYLRQDSISHSSKVYGHSFYPSSLQTQDLHGNAGSINNSSKISPTLTGPPGASRYGSFLEGSSTHSGLNRRSDPTISRPSSGRLSGNSQHELEVQDFEAMHDLNGTLASLDLDRPSTLAAQDAQVLSVLREASSP